ncbi:MAG: hypothetical protein RLZZ440_2834 [Planctomycetota bacterium]|jgi:hypothetical protein
MPGSTCPLTGPEVVDRYFMEHRAKLLDLAAFLDRLDRAAPPAARDDVRIRGLRRAIPLLLDEAGDRTRRILELLSDHSREPIAAAPSQGALGVDPAANY